MRHFRTPLLLLLAIALLAACQTPLQSRQDDVLAPYDTEVRLGGSVRDVLHRHPKHEAGGDGAYFFASVSPDNAQRVVRLRGVGDRILWLQLQDEPLAPDVSAEQTRYEREIGRLRQILGEPERNGNRHAATRSARWRTPDGELATLDLFVERGEQRVRRVLTLSLAP